MEHSASRHLRRRQLYIRYMVSHLCHIAYTRAWQIGKARAKPNLASITVETTDIDRVDNQDLATSAHTVAQALQILTQISPPPASASPSLRRLIIRMITRFAGERLTDPQIDEIMTELENTPPANALVGSPDPTAPNNQPDVGAGSPRPKEKP